MSVDIRKAPSTQYRRGKVALLRTTTCIKNVKFKIIEIRTGCQYVGYFYYSQNLNLAAQDPRLGRGLDIVVHMYRHNAKCLCCWQFNFSCEHMMLFTSLLLVMQNTAESASRCLVTGQGLRAATPLVNADGAENRIKTLVYRHWQDILKQCKKLDPERTGTVSPDAFVGRLLIVSFLLYFFSREMTN